MLRCYKQIKAQANNSHGLESRDFKGPALNCAKHGQLILRWIIKTKANPPVAMF